RDVKRLSGFRHAMPLTTAVAVTAAAAMAGVPLLNGFLSKEMFFAEALLAGEATGLRITLPAIAVVAALFSVAYSVRFIHQVFFGPPAHDRPREPRERTRGMLAPSVLLVATCVLVGVLPARTLGPLLETAARALLGPAMPEYRLAVWHGFTVPLAMSLIALGGGVA